MQEISGSLSEVIRAYSDHNLLVPAATDVQLNPFYKYHVEEVAVDLSENSGDIFKVGSVKTGKTDSKGIHYPNHFLTNWLWQLVFSLIHIRHTVDELIVSHIELRHREQ